MSHPQTEETAAEFAEHGCTVPAIPFTVEKDALPKEITKAISHLLHMAAHYYRDGEEHPLLFVALDKDAHEHLIDPRAIPIKALVTQLVKRVLDKIDAVAVLTISEGWSLPPEVAKAWEEGGRPEGMSIKDHPEAFDVLFLNVESIAGMWTASVKVSPLTEPPTPRVLEGDLIFKEMGLAKGGLNNLLKVHRDADEETHPMVEFLMSIMGITQENPDGTSVQHSLADEEKITADPLADLNEEATKH